MFVTVGLRLGSDRFYDYFDKFGLLEKTGIDLPGEAGTIMHSKENIGLVELATISFGQSFQITPIQVITTVSSLINGGKRITPHMAVKTVDEEGNTKRVFQYDNNEQILSEETSATLRKMLEKVVSEGGGKNGAVAAYAVMKSTTASASYSKMRFNHAYPSSPLAASRLKFMSSRMTSGWKDFRNSGMRSGFVITRMLSA